MRTQWITGKNRISDGQSSRLLPRMRGAGVRDRPSGQPVRVVRIVSRNSSTRANRYVKTKSEIEKRNRRLVFPSLIKTVRPEPSREKPPKKGNEAAMPAKRRWLNPKNEGRDQFPSGWARYRQSRPDLAVLYSGEAWRARRAEQLREHPTCAVCGEEGRHRRSRREPGRWRGLRWPAPKSLYAAPPRENPA